MSQSTPLAGHRDPFQSGAMFADRYRILHVLGRGGMGVVYHAEDLLLGQPVALKFLPPGLQPYFEQHLLHEVRMARRISHPNVCRVYDVGKAERLRFLSMEYIDGENLATLLRQIGRLPPERAVAIGRDVCGGLAAAHDQEILHRDLKPANLMIGRDGRVRITDFGIAAWTGAVGAPEARWGTRAYMAPEQRAGREVSIRSDLYALGLVLYELMTGIRATSRQPLEPPSHWVDGLAVDVEQILLQCLAEDPAQRPASVREVAAALGEAAAPTWRAAPRRTIPQRPQWVLERRLGNSGFGEVWLAVHDQLGEHRVFKFCRDTSTLFSLKREITLFRLLREELGQRDDIVRILDWNFDEAPYFIESEYVEGGDLLEWAENAGGIAEVPLATRLEIVAQVADALAAAHSVGVLHKDVKPGNVLVEAEAGIPRIRLADFGIGRALDKMRLDDAGITVMGLTWTGSGQSSGTLLYQAPELLEGKAPTVQADVYSLGVLLYQLVVGDLGRALGPGWEHDVAHELLREDVSAAVDRDPLRRLADAGAMASRLRHLEARRDRRAAERRARQQSERDRQELEQAVRRRRILTAALGVALLVTALVLVLAGRIASQAARQRDLNRGSVAEQWMDRDPTRAALVLLEIEEPDEIPYAVSRIRRALQHELALFELRHGDDLVAAAWSPSGEKILTASEDGVLRLSSASGQSEQIESESSPGGCSGILTSAAWNPDGKRFAVACHDGTVWVFSDSDASPAPLISHGATVWTVVWHPDGESLAATSEDGTVWVWQNELGTSPGEWTAISLTGHEKDVTAAAWSPDGQRLATASLDGTARVWQLSKASAPSLTHVLKHDAGRRVWMAVWSPRGDRILTASNDATARIWTLRPSGPQQLEPTVVFEGHREAVRVAVWSPDGERVLTASQDRTARVWSSTGEPLGVLAGHQGGLRAASWSTDGKWILTCADDGQARLWRWAEDDSGSGEPWAVFAGYDAWVSDAAWSPDGERILTRSGQMARVWRASVTERGSGEPLVLGDHQAWVRRASWSPDGTRIATASDDGSARIWHVGAPGRDDSPAAVRPRVTLVADHQAEVRTVSWSPDGTRIVTASEDGTAKVWPAGGEGPPVILSGHKAGLVAAAFDPAGQRIVTASKDGTARIWHAGAEPVILPGDAGKPLETVAWSPEGTRLVTVAAETGYLWQVGTRTSDPGEPTVLPGHTKLVYTAAWSPDGEHLVTASEDGTARVWRTGKQPSASRLSESPVVLDHGATTAVWTAAFSPSGERIVTGATDGAIRVWRLDGTGETLLERHRFVVTSVVFSPDGEWILSASTDDTALLQRPDGTGEPIVLGGHAGWVSTATWSPRGDRIVTASRDATARVWRFATSDLTTLLRGATKLCLDPEFRQKALGDAPTEAWRRYAACERSHGRLPPEVR